MENDLNSSQNESYIDLNPSHFVMNQLLIAQEYTLSQINNSFSRSLFGQINWANRLIGIKGPRGAGKTTMMLQRIKFWLSRGEYLYVSADHPYFYNHQLYELGLDFVQKGGKYLFIDEVHKYPNWSRELKSLHDGFPQLFIVFSSSSALEIFKGEADLSRRVSVYNLPGMSFREYLQFKQVVRLEKIGLQELISNHQEVASSIIQQIHPLAHFAEYLVSGYLPFAAEMNVIEYQKRLQNIITTTLETDLLVTQGYSAANSQKMKRLLGTLAEIVPYEPNIADLARKLTMGRDTVLDYLQNLEKARLLNFVYSDQKGMTGLRKPHKIFLENTNLSYALMASPEIGALRETFVLNQLINAQYQVEAPRKGDFLVDGTWTFEVGGRNKSFKQITDILNSFILADDISVGSDRKIPLWMLGLLS